MAKTIEEILGKSINSTKELRAAIKELQDQLVSASAGTQEWTDTADKLTAAQAKLNEVMSAGKSGIDAVEDSIVGMEKKYKELYNTYKLLSEEQRNSPFGREMADELENLSNKLNETKKGVGNFKDNIGRYAQDAVAAFSSMGVSIGGLASPLNLANGGFKTLNATIAANPIFWLITAIKLIIGLFNKLKEAIMSNEESQMAWNEAMAAFQPITDAVANSFDKLGQVVVKVVGWIADAFRKAREVKAIITDFLGITKGEADAVREQNELYKELAKRTNELTKAKREQQVLNANQEAEVKRLLDEAAATTNATEKAKLLNQAKTIQGEITARNIKIAEDEYKILLAKSKLTANDAATNDKLAQAEANVAKAKADGAAKTKEMTSQITSLTKGTNSYSNAIKKEKDELKSLLKTIEENSKTEIQKLEEKYKKELALLKKYKKNSTELTKQYNLEMAKLNGEERDKKNSLAEQLIGGAYGEESEQFMRLQADIADNAYQLAQQRFAEAKAAAAKEGADVEHIWKTVAANLGGVFEGITNENEAAVALKAVGKAAEDANKAYTDFLDTSTRTSQEISNETALLKKKTEIIENEKLTEEEKNFLIKELDDEALQRKIDNLKFELDTLDLTNEQKLEKWNEYYNALKEQDNATTQQLLENETRIREQVEARWDVAQAWTNEGANLLDSVYALGDAISQNIELSLEDEKTTEEAAKKKKKQLKALQDMQLALTIATIAADTASGIMNIWKGYAAEKAVNAAGAAATGPAAPATFAVLEGKSLAMAILQTTSLGVMGAAQIAAAIAGNISSKKSIDGMGGGGGGGSAAGTMAAPAVIDTTPYSYTRQVQTTEEEDALNRPIFVSVTDIESGLNHAQVVQNESSW